MQISYDEGNVVLTEVRDFDLAQTLECGQCFHFKKLAEQEYAVCAFHRLLRIRQEKDSVILFDTTMQDYEMIWRDYFDFGRDYGRIKAALLQTADTAECEKMLTKIKGVGSKVANCCMLFGLDKRDAFPVDVWIKRIMEQLYFSGKETDKEKIAAFAKTRFGSYGGYAQQYLFFYGKTVRIGTQNQKIKKV